MVGLILVRVEECIQGLGVGCTLDLAEGYIQVLVVGSTQVPAAGSIRVRVVECIPALVTSRIEAIYHLGPYLLNISRATGCKV